VLRYLYEFGSTINIPTPKCAVLLSPWVDPFYFNPTGNQQRSTDFVPGTYGGKQSDLPKLSPPYHKANMTTQPGEPTPMRAAVPSLGPILTSRS
jgi:hypothetical protein